jgi:hypothetical protein
MSSPFKGIDFGKFAVSVQPNKIILSPKDQGDIHYTVHLGGASGILDVHQTWKDAKGGKQYRTIFAMQKADLQALLCEIALPAINQLTGIVRKLRVGWLHHRRIGILAGVIPTEDELGKITKMTKKRRLAVDEDAFAANIRAPKFLDDVLSNPDCIFTLMAVRRGVPNPIGFGYKVTAPNGRTRLFWTKMSDMSTVINQLQDLIIQTARRYDISK